MLGAAARLFACTLLPLVAVATPCLGQTVSIEVGGVQVMIPVPEDTCPFPETYRKAAADHFNRAPHLVVGHVFVGDCEQIRAMGRQPTRLRDYMIVAAPGRADDKGTDRSKLIDEMEAMASRFVPKAAREVHRLSAADYDIQLGERRTLLVIRDVDGLYVGGVNRPPSSDGFRQLSVTAYTLLNRRLVYYHLYSDYENEQSLPLLLKRAQGEIARAVAIN
jgi:hypothetical protein